MDTTNKLSKEAKRDLQRIRQELNKSNPNGQLIAYLLNGDKYNMSIIK